jgi:hypothetical protein
MFFIYGAENSSACNKAEILLLNLKRKYKLYIFGRDYTFKQYSRIHPGENTVPQIYYGTKYIGSVRQLYNYLYSEEALYESESWATRTEGFAGLFDSFTKDKQSKGDV